eukprot:1087935-Amphidinium_carterae.1
MTNKCQHTKRIKIREPEGGQGWKWNKHAELSKQQKNAANSKGSWPSKEPEEQDRGRNDDSY